MNDKKYYSISEVAQYFDVSQPKLRYLETIVPKFKVHKIRGRRYYTKENLEQLKSKLHSSSGVLSVPDILFKISRLEKGFFALKNMLEAA